ncbi:bifunctional tRNA (5-methylaminomethyl-2-thiouridine)(34)-methyltransferase MnmD/FAD-dependent 5-carboxymethylaminomethyl-2-thiouridine(34) oxidoreductase MnmC [Alteromonas sp. A079]|uniref:bifunctional tRNA (5-methylaminomethyl-2-thiouridine)(34)-methyltransferase MnmD/FAD-dependent 5-carboxymethylaminomethyl-2-thiouridine(34) oxidoreductase MnmC n=1 Tax=Alteromonas sp. A079 TaxID=3410268 RepID=UPI003B9E72F7
MKSQQAKVHFNENGTPVADHFDDVYFSNDSGINETEHVFINGNDLLERWADWQHPVFVIAETGFGTGLNFLVAMRAFAQFKAQHPSHCLTRLHFISTEKFPLPHADMQQALKAFPSLCEEAKALGERYPMHLEGCHRIHFDEHNTTLDLWIGDVHTLLPQWPTPTDGLVDAWFLDGFAPSKNPDMWTDALFSQMARLSKHDTTFGTFTAAGIVKRGLAAVGFTIKKRKGFGRKRDMITGTFDVESPNTNQRLRAAEGPYYRYHRTPLNTDSHVVVVGSGLAAATTVLSLVKRGIRVSLCFDEDTLATGASGNPQGGFYPQLHSEASIASKIQAHGFLYAAHCYQQLFTHTEHVDHDFCGVLQLSFNDKSLARHKKLSDANVWPTELIDYVTPAQASDIASLSLPYPGLFMKKGGWISPPQLVRALIARAKQCGDVTLFPAHTYADHRLHDVDTSPQVTVSFENGSSIQADHLILATGAGAVNTHAFSAMPLRPVRGQVEAIATQAPISQLTTVLCHKGYMTPALHGRHALGSTYVKDDLATQVRAEETQDNLAMHEQALSKTDIISTLQHDGTARAAIRLGSPDHHPVVGMLDDFKALKANYAMLGLGKPLATAPTLPNTPVSTLACLGSRGLTTSPLMAELLVSSLCHEPLPVENTLSNALNTSRFMTRDAIRGLFEDNA